MIKCQCGKEFEKSSSYNSHKRFCEQAVRTPKKNAVFKSLVCTNCKRKFDKPQQVAAHYGHCIGKSKTSQLEQSRKKQKGVTYEEKFGTEKAKLVKSKLSVAGKDRKFSLETRQKISKSLTGRTGGFRENSNKWKKFTFALPNGEIVHLDSSYELRFVLAMETLGILWKKTYESFPYVFNGKNRKYIPDFYLKEKNIWIEVKGWKKEIDDYKWRQFPHDLVVIDKNRLRDLENGNFDFALIGELVYPQR